MTEKLRATRVDPGPSEGVTCLAEDCANWTGMGCVCAFLDLEPVDVRESEAVDD